ncbi:MAG TPA: serine hydrolase [Pseudolabrys sp.]|nr:serine hydrolase [Pseudolabrys sp.]
MLLRGGLVGRYLRCGVVGLAALTVASVIGGDADARARRTHHSTAYEPDYSSIVVDVNSGAVMQATKADASRHPASLTKIMTLYLLFERLEAGKIKLNSELQVSAHAAAQAPSKLGLKPGETIKVETAIRAIVTKSANDVAVIVGEALGGDEPSFARMMTAKARALGMEHTTYRNCSGLPDDGQVTTARDQALLGRAIQDRFPNYYHYFSTRAFEFRGRSMRNHNHLLGTVDGVDGIKTGYIHDSGFNIVTSVRRGKRHIVAVVFGGRTASARDARARSLIDNNINIAATKRTAPPVAEGTAMAETRLPASPPAPAHDPRNAEVNTAAPALGSTAPITPTAVKTVSVHAGPARSTALSPLPSASRQLAPAPATAKPATVTTIATVKSEPPAIPAAATPGILGVLRYKEPEGSTDEVRREEPKTTHAIPVASKVMMPPPEPTTAAKPRGGWMIQVGAFPEEKAAKERLNDAQSKAKAELGRADPFTEKVTHKEIYRARFAGLDKDQAETACKHLKRSDIPCMLLRN